MNSRKSVSFHQTIKPFLFFQKFFGLAPFEFSSELFKISKSGFIAFVLNISILFIVAIFLQQADTSFEISRVLITGLRFSIKIIIVYCIIIIATNFVLSKKHFKLLQLFKRFDENYLKFTKQLYLYEKTNKKALKFLRIAWILKILYFLLFTYKFTQRRHVLPIVIYELIFLRQADEVFIIYAYLLFERLKMLKLSCR